MLIAKNNRSIFCNEHLRTLIRKTGEQKKQQKFGKIDLAKFLHKENNTTTHRDNESMHVRSRLASQLIMLAPSMHILMETLREAERAIAVCLARSAGDDSRQINLDVRASAVQ